MKATKQLAGAFLLGAFTLSSLAWAADDNAPGSTLKPYPLKSCLVSGKPLGSMGEPYVHSHKDREIKFCCKGCLKDFNKNPEKFLKNLDR